MADVDFGKIKLFVAWFLVTFKPISYETISWPKREERRKSKSYKNHRSFLRQRF